MSKITLTKEEFVKYINTIKTIHDSSERLHEALQNYDECSDFSGFTNFRALTLAEDLLAKLMNDAEDEYGYTMINYFTQELEFGSKYEEGMITEEDGTPVDLSTAEALYDYLVKTSE